jgi:hypothetical protein
LRWSYPRTIYRRQESRSEQNNFSSLFYTLSVSNSVTRGERDFPPEWKKDKPTRSLPEVTGRERTCKNESCKHLIPRFLHLNLPVKLLKKLVKKWF